MTRRVVPQLPPGTRGLKRDAALVALSRDHHGVLVQALALRRAAGPPATLAQARAAAVTYLRFHEAEIRGHMADEEDVLLPLTAGTDPHGAARIAAEHREIEALAAALREAHAGGVDPRPIMQALGELLDDHVRFEERGYFMRVQERLDGVALEHLGRALGEHRDARGITAGCPVPPR